MTCTTTDLPVITHPLLTTAPPHITGVKSGSTRFMISDNPETIGKPTDANWPVKFTNGFATLWHDYVANKNTLTYRIFVWHLNTTGKTLKYGVTIGNGSNSTSTPGTIQISNLKHSIVTTGSYVSHGICSAQALLANTLDSASPVDTSITAGNVGLVKEWPVESGKLIGGIIEFTLKNTSSSTAPMAFRVRSSVADTTTANLRTNSTPVIDRLGTHPRGSWDFADIQSNISFQTGALNSYQYYSFSNGTNDNLMTQTSSYDGGVNGQAYGDNKGHYGVKNKVNITFKNTSTTESRKIKVFVTSRVKPFGGAIQWHNNAAVRVPALKVGTSTQDMVQVVTFTLAPNASATYALTTSTAGSLSTPGVIAIQTLAP
ncbi:hypothetical protein ABER99_21275 [Paenibacillus glucanolyticus]|jgi:hypothetical protein|uniref:Uncharacterized protein n=1 Tax=Paenibacillus glucanolyticus TaxID=59843 RepID=A0A163G7E3_9BACL|nr:MULTISPECIES: hypothetical protein [Paenibacillus]KZS44774.1 hypothetical protein AWU65_01930 [Paenibacillus glucanolyticus]MDH6675700.1 hypothetical protein [Paenibacillus sp. LBL]OMF64439.1 hypothetical protein BK142_31820 [Paenibacillus glucanolyticus]